MVIRPYEKPPFYRSIPAKTKSLKGGAMRAALQAVEKASGFFDSLK